MHRHTHAHSIVVDTVEMFTVLGMNRSCALQVAASVRLHNRLLDSIMRLPSSFFDTNPSGRIINRFSRDTEIMDSVLPLSLIQLGACVSNYIAVRPAFERLPIPGDLSQ